MILLIKLPSQEVWHIKQLHFFIFYVTITPWKCERTVIISCQTQREITAWVHHTNLTAVRTNQSGFKKPMKYVHNNRVVPLQVVFPWFFGNSLQFIKSNFKALGTFFSTCNFYFLLTSTTYLHFFFLFNSTSLGVSALYILSFTYNPHNIMLCLSLIIIIVTLLSINCCNCAVLVAPTQIFYTNGNNWI